MTDPARPTRNVDDAGMDYESDARTGLPRWVKVAGIVVAVVVLVVVVVLLIGGGGGHSPRRHG